MSQEVAMAMVSKTSPKKAGPKNSVAPQSGFREVSGVGVKVSPGKGGVNIGTPTHCVSTRAAGNVKAHY
jgi:hypothetical protein